MSKALIVVDVQNDFCEGGALAVAGGNDVAQKIASKLTHNVAYDYVVATKDSHVDPGDHFAPPGQAPNYVDTWPQHCVYGTVGAEFNPALDSTRFDTVFFKGEREAAYSGFEGKTLDKETLADWLNERDVDTVEIVGLATDHCVRATALDAVANGFETVVLNSYCAAVSPQTESAALREMEKAGVQIA